jgi:hypothetical protein
MKRERRNILPSVSAVPIPAASPEAGRKWPKPLRRGRMENVASFLILAGAFLLMQPFSLTLYAYSFITILIGTAMFIVVSHFPE